MTGLLVSVRDASEAEESLQGGASIIDVKEPLHGPLGAAAAVHWHRVHRRVARQVPVSVALGELLDESIVRRVTQLPSVAFAKIGLAGCRTTVDWQSRWTRVIDCFPPGVAAVAVVYADWQAAEAPIPPEIIGAAIALGCRAVLFDTFDKRAGWLLDYLDVMELQQLTGAIRHAGLKVVLAGSITAPRLEDVLPLAPDWIAVRGAACDGPRTGRVNRKRVRDLADRVCRDHRSATRPSSAEPVSGGRGVGNAF